MPVPSRSFLVSILLLLIADLAWAGPVTGRVVDPDGRAVRGATVLLVDGASVVATTLTDEAGAFTIAAPHDGPFEILASVDGLRARPVSVRGDGNVGEIKLEVSAVRESVVVSAAQVEVPLSTTSSSVTILTEDDLASLQVRDLPEALRMVPGLSIVSAGGYGAQTSAFPRGGESDYSMVFIDGVQANAFGGGFDFAHVPLMNVERIEIVRGPQSALYGSNAIGSVIRIVSKRGGAPTASALVEGGSFGTSRFGGRRIAGSGPLAMGRLCRSHGQRRRRRERRLRAAHAGRRRWLVSTERAWRARRRELHRRRARLSRTLWIGSRRNLLGNRHRCARE